MPNVNININYNSQFVDGATTNQQNTLFIIRKAVTIRFGDSIPFDFRAVFQGIFFKTKVVVDANPGATASVLNVNYTTAELEFLRNTFKGINTTVNDAIAFAPLEILM